MIALPSVLPTMLQIPCQLNRSMLWAPFYHLPISANVRGCCTNSVQALLSAESGSHCHPIVHVWHHGCRHCCHCYCHKYILHYFITCIIKCNEPQLMASVAHLSIPPIGVTTGMILTIQTATITLTTPKIGRLELKRLPLIPLVTLQLRWWEHNCPFCILIHWELCIVDLQLFQGPLLCIGQGVNFVSHQLGETPPIIILRYTLYPMILVLALQNDTTTNGWAIAVLVMLHIIHLTVNYQWVLLWTFTFTQPHSWHLVGRSPPIQLYHWFVVLFQPIPQHLHIFPYTLLVQQRPLHRKENCQLCNFIMLLSWFRLCHVHHILLIWCIICTVHNAVSMPLFQEYFHFQTAALVVHTIKYLNLDCCQFGHPP